MLRFHIGSTISCVIVVKSAFNFQIGDTMYAKLSEDATLNVMYGDNFVTKEFKKGTIFLGTRYIKSDIFYVYLDDDGDGELDIPWNLLDQVEEKDIMDWNLVVGD